MTTTSLPRRTVLAALPAGAILSQLGPIRRALAQDEGAFKRQLQASRDIATELADRAWKVPGGVDSQRVAVLHALHHRPAQAGDSDLLSSRGPKELQRLDYRGRRDLANAASGLSQTQLREHVRQEFSQAANTMVERAVPLIPPAQDIEQVSTFSEAVGDSCPPAGDVMWDILFDALGLLDEREFFMAALHAVSGTSERVEMINDSLNEDSWGRALDGIFELLEFLLEGGTVRTLAQVLDERLAKRFLQEMATRLVPFVGTGYAIAAFGLAVHRHLDRLLCPR